MISAVYGTLQSNMTENSVWWNEPVGEEQVHSGGTSLCSLDVNRPKINTGMISASNKDQNIPVHALASSWRWLSHEIVCHWESLGCSRGAFLSKHPLCLLGDMEGAVGAHTCMGGLTMGLSKLCLVRAASVRAAEVLMWVLISVGAFLLQCSKTKGKPKSCSEEWK